MQILYWSKLNILITFFYNFSNFIIIVITLFSVFVTLSYFMTLRAVIYRYNQFSYWDIICNYIDKYMMRYVFFNATITLFIIFNHNSNKNDLKKY